MLARLKKAFSKRPKRPGNKVKENLVYLADGTEIVSALQEAINQTRKGNITDLALIASVKIDDDVPGILYHFSGDNPVTTILGLLTRMQSLVIRYMDDYDAGMID